MLECGRWTWTSPGSNQVQGRTSSDLPNDNECIVKQEATQCCVEAGDSGEAPGCLMASINGVEEAVWSGADVLNAAAVWTGLYDEHEVKDELVLGPERLQPQDIAVELAVASNNTEESVKQEPVQSGVIEGGNGESPSISHNLHLRSCLEQLVHRICYVRLERTPISKELHTCQTPHKAFDPSRLICERNKHTETETDVCTKTKSYICNYCEKQFAQETNLIKHIHIHIDQNSDTLKSLGSGESKVKHKLIKRQYSRPCSKGPRSRESSGVHVGLRTCHVRLERVLVDKQQQDAMDHMDNGYVSNDSAVDTKITRKEPYCDICEKKFSSLKYLKKHIVNHLWGEEFICVICKKKFSEKCLLIKHIVQVHKDQQIRKTKVYSCKFCKKVLSSRNALNVHERIHTGEKPFCCNICTKQFSDKKILVRHKRIHTGEKPFTCEFCMRKFTDRSNLISHSRMHTLDGKHHCKICRKSFIFIKKHMLIHTGEKPHVCESCGKAFNCTNTLQKHRRVHNTVEFFACEICKRRFQSQKNLEHHKQSCTLEKPFKCDVCMKQFKCGSVLRKHIRIHTGEKPYTCEICQKPYTTVCGLLKHQKVPVETSFTCDICKKQLKDKHSVIYHMRTHTGEKPYECEICQKKFSRHHHMVIHKKIHTAERFSCTFCPKYFKTEQKLVSHIQIHMSREPYACEVCQKPYTTVCLLLKHKPVREQTSFICDICKKTFRTKQAIIIHMRTHVGEKCYACEICQKSFMTYAYMLKHKKIHTEKRFTCNICPRRFKTKQMLLNHKRTHTRRNEKYFTCDICKKQLKKCKHAVLYHMRTHTGEKPYACEICQKSFAVYGNMLRHKKIHTEKRFNCDICQRHFKTKQMILSHIRTHKL